MKLLGLKMVYSRPDALSLSSTLRCQLGKDFEYSPAPSAEFRTTWRTPVSRQASTILFSSSTSSRTGEHTRYTSSTPSSAPRRLGLSAKSAITAGIPAGTLAASSRDRYIARNGLLVLRTSLRTAPPALPEAPVTRIMVILLGGFLIPKFLANFKKAKHCT